MENKSITKNYIYNLIYQILILILPLISTPYISRVLGAENIGIYSYTISIITYFILFGSLGITMYAQREIAYVQDDKEKRSKVFWEITIFRCITILIAILIYNIYINKTEYQLYYKILAVEFIATCLDISWFFQGIEEFKKTITRNIIIKILSIISIFIFVKDKNDLNNYFIIYVVSNLLGNLSLWLYLPKYIQKVKMKSLNLLKHLKPTISLFIPQIAIQVYILLDKVMLGIIIPNKSEVGYYEQSQKIVKILLTLITALGTVMMPRIANNFIKGEKEKVRQYLLKSVNFVLFLSIPMIVGIIVVSDKFVPLFFGNGYDEVIKLMMIISPILLMIGISNVIGTQYLLPTKRQKEYTISVMVGAVVNFLLNLILIRKNGALGASIATVIAETSVTAIQLYFIRKEINIRDIVKSIKKYLVAALIMFLICTLLENAISNNVSDIITLILQVVLGTIVYICTLLYFFKDDFAIYVKEKIKNLIKNKKSLAHNLHKCYNKTSKN